VLGALSCFGPLSSDMYLPGLPEMTRDLHASAAAGNLTLTGSVLGIALGQLVAGPVSDSRGRLRPLLIGLAGFSIASALCAVAPSIWLLLVVRLLQGFAGGTSIVIARAIVRDLYTGDRAAHMFSTLMMISGLAPIVAPVIGGQVLNVSSWRGIFVVLTAVGALLFLLAWRTLTETLPVQRRQSGGLAASVRVLGTLMRSRRYAPYAVSFALSFGTMFAFIAGGAYVTEDVYGLSPQLFSLIFAANSIGFAVMAQSSRRLVGRVAPARLMRWGVTGVAVCSAGAFLATLGPSPAAVLLPLVFLILVCNGLVLPNGISAAMAGLHGDLGAASALIGLSQFGLGALLAPLVGIGGAHDALPMGVVMLVCGVLALGVNLTAGSVRR
jgi:MFS transporter, DHA1 family, multidrug resistance protein